MSDHCWHQVARDDCRMPGMKKNTVPICCKCGKQPMDCGFECVDDKYYKHLLDQEEFFKGVSALGDEGKNDGR